MFPAARAVLLSMRASEDFVCAEKLSAAEQVKPDCCRTPAVVSIFTDSAACVLSFYHSTPLHIYILYIYIYIERERERERVLLLLSKIINIMVHDHHIEVLTTSFIFLSRLRPV